ncbi:MBOAT family protein [Brevibacillus sp. SYP-B805]|uniref:MBOAT family O-acyltransferase n=1 Tax=Brevibacillus sp. SYP-B805 TaxID=1578199 RepID=UPI0013EA7BE6|nr:MBOAT family protein [Brevibacillus sp. SYP-B805]NGQ93705.1 MBOAT family protein [Brevibacillus sp. SYP-B805]
MLFNSYEFIFLYLPITFTVYFLLNRCRLTKLAIAWLALASLFFYSWWNVNNLPLMLGSILFNYTVGTLLSRDALGQGGKKALLIFGVTMNLAFLGYYKYADFFLANINFLFSAHFPFLHLVLPLGISFFTFTQIAYLVDTYKGTSKEYNFVNYVLFVTFFPHLIAGPILHHKEMMPQFENMRAKVINWRNISHGLLLFGIGLFKKVVIADTFATWANPGFSAASLTMTEAWATALSYTFQLYFDFSGYTDMALGIALLFNIKLPQNFQSPYKADSIIDFWRRWHMTLSRFLRDYLYIALGGNRRGAFRRYLNLMITMVLGGLWHGAAWTFVVWGFMHGAALVVNHLWRSLGFRMHWLLGRLCTFLFVVVAWVFFRAESFAQAMVVLKGMVNWRQIGLLHPGASAMLPWGRKELVVLAIAFLFVSTWKNSAEWDKSFTPGLKWAVAVSVLIVAGLIGLNRVSEFLYFQF